VDGVHTPSMIASLRGKEVLNIDEVKASVNFADSNVDPYPPLWYDTTIDYDNDCYVVYPNATDRLTYELRNLNKQTVKEYEGRAFLTHTGACGVCSTLDDLAVYIETPDLTTPVRKCALQLFEPLIMGCLKNLGFTHECSRIWFWNAKNTRKLHVQGGCFGTCFARILADNNSPSGSYNPCQPLDEIRKKNKPMVSRLLERDGSIDQVNKDKLQVKADGSEALGAVCLDNGKVDGQMKASDKEYEEPETEGHCGNTINGKPACDETQWRNGPLRLNACLQCDECRSGPIFQKVAGRTRRASGIVSAIGRIGVQQMVHDYV